jgi:hypothetical protein
MYFYGTTCERNSDNKDIFGTMTTPATGGWSSCTLLNEKNKLKARETDWNLPGSSLATTRTRHNGQGRPNLERIHGGRPIEPQQEQAINVESSSDSEYLLSSSSSSSSEDEAEDVSKKPPASRVILDVSQLSGSCRSFVFVQDVVKVCRCH